MVEYGKSLGVEGISVFFIVLAGTLIISRPVTGYLTDKYGVAKIMFPALAVYGAAVFLLGFSSKLWQLLLGAVFAAIGFGASQPAIQAMSMQIEPPPRRGVASNTVYMGFDFGFFLGPFLGGIIYAQRITNHESLVSYSFMYKVIAAALALAIILFAAFLPTYNKRRLRVADMSADNAVNKKD